MIKMNQFCPILLIIFGLTFTGCNKCKECYFVEDVNGIKNEFSLGEFCGDEIEDKENEEYVCTDGNCFNECR